MTQTETAAYLKQAQTGNAEAFGKLYAGLGTELYRFALWYLKDPHLAQDAVQDACIKAYRSLRGLRDPKKLKPWFMKILAKEEIRSIPGVTVRMDGSPLERRDFIIGLEFAKMGCEQAVAEYEQRDVIVFERSATSLYSRRMVEAFGSSGVVRVSPLHVHDQNDIAQFLDVTREIAAR